MCGARKKNILNEVKNTTKDKYCIFAVKQDAVKQFLRFRYTCFSQNNHRG